MVWYSIVWYGNYVSSSFHVTSPPGRPEMEYLWSTITTTHPYTSSFGIADTKDKSKRGSIATDDGVSVADFQAFW